MNDQPVDRRTFLQKALPAPAALLAVLEGFKKGEALWLPLTYFQLWMARLAGWLPTLDACGRCRRPVPPRARRARSSDGNA